MGDNADRLDRLVVNRSNFGVEVLRGKQERERDAVANSVDQTWQGLQAVAREDGFEGDLGELINARITKIQVALDDFGRYQRQLSAVVANANHTLEETSGKVDSLPAAGMSESQQSTVDLADRTGSPVRIGGREYSAGDAAAAYAAQAEQDREEAARKLTVALDQRLQEIIDGMPNSKFDEESRSPENPDDGGTGGRPTVGGPSVGTGGPGVTGPDGNGTGTGGYDGPGTGGRPPVHEVSPPRYPDPEVRPPGTVDPPRTWPPINQPPGTENPNIDGGTGGTIPGPGGGLTPPGGGFGPGGGLTVPGGVGGGVGVVGGVGGMGRVNGGGLLGGAGGVGGVGGLGGGNGVGGAAGASSAGGGGTAAVAQSGSAAGGRGGMVAGGGAAGGAGGGRGKKRRRGQDLLAYEVDPEDDEAMPDLGAAGSAGSAASDGREELGW